MAGDGDADGNEVVGNDEEHKKTTSKKVSVHSRHAWTLKFLFAASRCQNHIFDAKLCGNCSKLDC